MMSQAINTDQSLKIIQLFLRGRKVENSFESYGTELGAKYYPEFGITKTRTQRNSFY